MFDKYLILDDSLSNIGPKDAPTGFQFQARLGYYRGLGLSMVEDLSVVLDGAAAPRAAVRFNEGEGEITLDAMEEAYDRRWEFGAVATIIVDQPGGLAAGDHQLDFSERLRISYLPFPLVATDTKRLALMALPNQALVE